MQLGLEGKVLQWVVSYHIGKCPQHRKTRLHAPKSTTYGRTVLVFVGPKAHPALGSGAGQAVPIQDAVITVATLHR